MEINRLAEGVASGEVMFLFKLDDDIVEGGDFTFRDFCVSEEFPECVPDLEKTIGGWVEIIFLLTRIHLQPMQDYSKVPIKIILGFMDPELDLKMNGKKSNRYPSSNQKGLSVTVTTVEKSKVWWLGNIYAEWKKFYRHLVGELILYTDEQNMPIKLTVALQQHGRDHVVKKVRV